jgi:hypothetical protein
MTRGVEAVTFTPGAAAAATDRVTEVPIRPFCHVAARLPAKLLAAESADARAVTVNAASRPAGSERVAGTTSKNPPVVAKVTFAVCDPALRRTTVLEGGEPPAIAVHDGPDFVKTTVGGAALQEIVSTGE